MQVTETTKLADIAEFIGLLDEDSVKRLKEGAEAKYGGPWGLTIGQFFACSEGDFSHIGADVNTPSTMTALQYYWVISFKDMCEQLAKVMENLSLPQTPDAKMASKVCRPMAFKESTLVFCREYFGLKSFKEVYDLSIDDFLLAKKDTYNKVAYEKAMAEIQSTRTKI